MKRCSLYFLTILLFLTTSIFATQIYVVGEVFSTYSG